LIRYFIVFILFLAFPAITLAEQEPSVELICISEQDVVDLITLLDSSERDLQLLDTCQKLAKDLYKEIDVRDIRIQRLTKDLISSKQDSLRYQAHSKRWRNVALITGTSSIILIIVQLLPVL
jgi:hypothetical protein